MLYDTRRQNIPVLLGCLLLIFRNSRVKQTRLYIYALTPLQLSSFMLLPGLFLLLEISFSLRVVCFYVRLEIAEWSALSKTAHRSGCFNFLFTHRSLYLGGFLSNLKGNSWDFTRSGLFTGLPEYYCIWQKVESLFVAPERAEENLIKMS